MQEGSKFTRATCLFVGVAALLLCNQPALAQQNSQPVVHDLFPRSGPLLGGSTLHVTGEGFIVSGDDKSRCVFDDSNLGSAVSAVNIVHNSSYLSCLMPEIIFLQPQTVQGGQVVSFAVSGDAGARSNRVDFLVFDLSDMHTSAVEPNEGIYSSQNEIDITGGGFIETQEMVCSIDGVSVPATLISDSLLRCVLPAHPIPARVTVAVLLNGQVSSAITADPPDSNLFTFFATAPVVVDCTFSSSYSSLLLSFDREVEIGGESSFNTTQAPDCELLFTAESLNTLGTSPLCYWFNTQQMTVMIELPGDTSITPDSILSFRGDSIRTRYVRYSRLTTGNTTVRSHSENLIPIPVISAPEFIPFCGNFTLSAQDSQNGGPKALEYRWSLRKHSEDGTTTVQDSALEEYVSGNFTSNPFLIIPSGTFQVDALYEIRLEARNFLQLASSSTTNTTKLDQPAPVVAIEGAQSRQVATDGEITLEGAAAFPDCLGFDDSSIVFSWGVALQMDLDTAASGSGLSDSVHLDLGDVNSGSSVLTLPAFFLDPDKIYVASLTVTVGDKAGHASVQLVTEYSSIRARINGGTRRSVWARETVVLDGRASRGINDDILSDISFSVSWNCSDVLTTPTSQCDTPQRISFTTMNDLILTVQADSLSHGLYNFSLTISYRNLESSTYQLLDVDTEQVPQISIVSPLKRDTIPVQETFVLWASVVSDYTGVVDWTSEYVVGYARLENLSSVTYTPLVYEIVSTVTQPSQNSSPALLYVSNATTPPLTNLLSLTVARNSLLPANSYRFRLQATDSLGRTGYAEIDILTESFPLGGRLDVAPTTGLPLSTRFQFTALQWTDETGDLPLAYQYGVRYSDEDQTYWLTGVLARNSLSALLPPPPPPPGGGGVEAVLHIFDANGAVARRTHMVDFTSSDIGSAEATIGSLMDDIEKQALDFGNWVEALADLMSLALAINSNQYLTYDLTEVQDVKARGVGLTIDLFWSQVPCSKSFLSQLLDLLRELTLLVELPEATLLRLLEMLELAAAKYVEFSEDTSSSSGSGFTEYESDLLLGVYGNLVATHSQHNGTRVREDVVVTSLAGIIPRVGYGICRQLGLGARAVVTTVQNLGVVSVSLANLPSGHMTFDSSDCKTCPFEASEAITIDFSRQLFEQYLQWPCEGVESSMCSGVCVTTAQFKFDLRWRGSPFASYSKTPYLSLSLANPRNGSRLPVQGLTAGDLTSLQFPVTTSVANSNLLECASWDENTGQWSDQGCTTSMNSDIVTCECSHFSETTVLLRCPSGYYDSDCTTICPQGLWGEECRLACDCSNRGTCSAHDGTCSCEPGWTGERCELVCPSDVWGKDCAELCLCDNGGSCDPQSGSCDCTPGWIGQYCNISCQPGFYGDGCSSPCQCRQPSECDRASGSCLCETGYTGPTCHEECPEGTYGDRCASICSCHDLGTESCDHISGRCYCRDSWNGLQCEFEITDPLPPPPLPLLSHPPPSPLYWLS